MRRIFLGLGLLACLGLGGILGLRYHARQERVQQLSHDWSDGDLAIGLIACRSESELYLGVPCDELLEAYTLRHDRAAVP